MYPQDSDCELIHQTQYSQPALFALEMALVKVWKSWGISPKYVVGHSLGEISAACCAGVFSLEDGLALVAKRAQLMQAQATDGQMWTVQIDSQKIISYVDPLKDAIAIAAVNGPQSLVISGETEAITAVIGQLEADGIKTQRLMTSHAFHSHLMAGVVAPFKQFCSSIEMHEPNITFISNLSGEVATSEVTSPEYWCDQILNPVLFLSDIQTLQNLGCNCLIEIGPKSTLLGLASQILDPQTQLLPSLSGGSSNWSSMLASCAALSVFQNIDWQGFDQPYRRYRFALPTYPFQRQPYWIERPKETSSTSLRKNTRLLGEKLIVPTVNSSIYQNILNSDELPLLNDHQIYQELVVSGAFHVVMMLDGALSQHPLGGFALKNIYFPEPLVLERNENKYTQLAITPVNATESSALLISFDDPHSIESASLKVATHAEATIQSGLFTVPKKTYAEIRERCSTSLSVAQFIQDQAHRQITLGPSYQWLKAIYQGDGEVLADIGTPSSLGGLHQNQLHPGLVDAAFGLLLASGKLDAEKTWLPFTIESICVYTNTTNKPIWGHLSIRKSSTLENIIADVCLVNAEDGNVLIEFKGLQARSAQAHAIQKYLPNPIKNLMMERLWDAIAIPPLKPSMTLKPYIIFEDDQGYAEQLIRTLSTHSEHPICKVRPGEQYQQIDSSNYIINPHQRDDIERLLQEITRLHGSVEGVINCWPINLSLTKNLPLTSAIEIHCQFLLELSQLLIASPVSANFSLCNLTRGAHGIQGYSQDIDISFAPLLGMSLSIASEHPELNIKCVDLDSAMGPLQINPANLGLFTKNQTPIWLAIREGQLFTPSLSLIDEGFAEDTLTLNAHSTYLVTGATKGLGLKTAQWLVNQGVKHLAILARNAPSGANHESIEQLRKLGVNIHIWQVDVSDRAALQAALQEIDHQMPPLKGVIHCSGILADKLLSDFEWQQFVRAFDAKVTGAWNLHELTQDKTLDFFVLFSSAASLLGNQGQTNYSAANAFLDHLAQLRYQAGLPASAINWGPWAEVGMLESDPIAKEHLAKQGFGLISSDYAFKAMAIAVNTGKPQVSIMDWDWQTYLEQAPRLESLFARLPKNQPQDNSAINPLTSTNVIEKLTGLSSVDRSIQIAYWVEESVRQTLGIPQEQALDFGKPLTDQGLDSLLAVQLRNQLGKTVQFTLPVSLAFNYPTIAEMIVFISALIEEALPAALDHVTPESTKSTPISSAAQSAQDLLADLEKLIN